MKATTALFVLSVAGIGAAHAADHGFYVGAGLGQSQLSPDQSRFNLSEINYDDKDQGYKLIAGFRPLDVLSAEVNYVDLGRTHGYGADGPVRSDAQLFDAAVLGYLPLPFVDVFGKAGVARSRANYREAGIRNLKLDSTDFTWGVGMQAHFGSLGARLEYERFNLPSINRASLVSLAVTWTFF
ncbi:MAG: outer membrane beta-barrel protein [Proteobacteria bacterium]|nr:outer membrane beta-barrel protein [Pseudomonadota bacterium]